MFHKGRMLLAALGLVGASVAGAQADLCFDYSTGGGTSVGKGFKIPAPNQCKPFNGFEYKTEGGMLTGTGCTSATGEVFILHYSYHDNKTSYPQSSYFESGVCRVPLPLSPGGNSGACTGTVLYSPPSGQSRFDAYARFYSCNKAVPE